MADNLHACDRDQAFLLPPDLREWLPSDHPAWFVLDAAEHRPGTGPGVTAGHESSRARPGQPGQAADGEPAS